MRIKNIKDEVIENIKSDKTLFIFSIINLTIIFLVLNMFCVTILNIDKLKIFVKNSMQIKLYLEDDITKEGIKKLEKSIYSYEGVINVKYISKDIALKKLADKLEIEVDYSTNPIPDTMLVMIDENYNLEKVSKGLESEPYIDEIESKSEVIIKLLKFIKGINGLLGYLYIVFSIPIFIIIFNLFHFTIGYRKKDINLMSLLGLDKWSIKKTFIIEGLVNITISTLLSISFFTPIYIYIKTLLEEMLPIFAMATIYEVLPILALVLFGVGGVITVIASLLSIKFFIKVSGE